MSHDTAQEAHNTTGRAVTWRASALVRATTWPSIGATQPEGGGGGGGGWGHSTAQRAPRHEAMRTRPGPQVCALCTQPSLDLVHCSKSLFRSLFMNTIHEVFKKIK